jgi:phosphopantothenoylcysteine decarboxylase
MKILLGITGSVAATLTPKIHKDLSKLGDIKVVVTERGRYFTKYPFNVLKEDFSNTYPIDVFFDSNEWIWEKKGDPVLHITLRDWADVLVIAPLSANTLGKMANGICDNLLTSIYRAWDMQKPLVIAPAMNTHMWNHPATKECLLKLYSWHMSKLHIVDPVEKELACGTTGIGAMADVSVITNVVKGLSK